MTYDTRQDSWLCYDGSLSLISKWCQTFPSVRRSHTRNITAWFILPKCSSFLVSAVEYRLWSSVLLRRIMTTGTYCFQYSLLNSIMMVRRMLFLLLNWTVLWEIHGNHILHHYVNPCITPKSRLEMETVGEIIDITLHFRNALHSRISKHHFNGNKLNFTAHFLGKYSLSPIFIRDSLKV